jgi:hypothetical protein
MNMKEYLINNRKYEFNGEPTLPFKLTGELKHSGWDIPSAWAIDSNNCGWINSAHGDALEKVDLKKLIFEHETEYQYTKAAEIRNVLGMKPKLPEFVRAAKAAGWTPPSDWDESKYEQ